MIAEHRRGPCLGVLLLPTLLLLSTLLLGGCELLGAGDGNGLVPSYAMPAVQMDAPVLVRAPSTLDVAAFYCPRVLGDPVSALACAATLGSPPPEEALRFDFDLVFSADNPNAIPIPTTEILAAVDVFEGRSQSELGAVCVQLCATSDPHCTGAPGPESCRSERSDIASIDDLAGAVVGLLVVAAGAAATGQLDNLLVRNLPAGARSFEIRVRFSLGVEAMVSLMEVFVGQLVDDVLAGNGPRFEIPYRVRGTLWFRIPLLGRVALGFGPFRGTWRLEP